MPATKTVDNIYSAWLIVQLQTKHFITETFKYVILDIRCVLLVKRFTAHSPDCLVPLFTTSAVYLSILPFPGEALLHPYGLPQTDRSPVNFAVARHFWTKKRDNIKYFVPNSGGQVLACPRLLCLRGSHTLSWLDNTGVWSITRAHLAYWILWPCRCLIIIAGACLVEQLDVSL